MKKISLNKSDIKKLNSTISFAYQLAAKNRVEQVFFDDRTIILLESKPILFEYDKKVFPTLFLLQENNMLLKKIVVDAGAVRFVANGADIMRPGVVLFDDNIAKDEAVVIIEQTYGKMLAVGLSLFTTEQMHQMEKGKIAKNLHHIGDDIWNYKEGK